MTSLPKVALTSIEQLAIGLFHEKRGSAPFMAMTAYLDESGTHGDASPAMLMSCFIATTDQWAAYERQLGQLLSDHGVAVFHAKKFRHGKGDFKDWDAMRRRRFNGEFLQIADRNLSCGFVSILSLKDYKEVYRAQPFPRRARPDTPYGLCFRMCLWKAVLFMKDRREHWPLSVILEDGHKNAADALRVHREEREKLRPPFKGVLSFLAHASKRDCPPLSAPDMLAYSMFRMVAGYTEHPKENVCSAGPADPPYIVSKVPMTRTQITRETLAAMRADTLDRAYPLPFAG